MENTWSTYGLPTDDTNSSTPLYRTKPSLLSENCVYWKYESSLTLSGFHMLYIRIQKMTLLCKWYQNFIENQQFEMKISQKELSDQKNMCMFPVHQLDKIFFLLASSHKPRYLLFCPTLMPVSGFYFHRIQLKGFKFCEELWYWIRHGKSVSFFAFIFLTHFHQKHCRYRDKLFLSLSVPETIFCHDLL